MNRISKYAIGTVFGIALLIRFLSMDFSNLDRHIITNYDGMGYYIYLPAIFIYNDITEYKWLDDVDKKYRIVGDDWKFQISKQENGNYVTKYLGGVSILQAPFFFAAHGYALITHHPADGFSVPYQVALSFGPLVYFILILFMMRKILLRYYSDGIVAMTLFLLFLASNAIEYVAIEAGHSHGYILLMYTLIIWLSINWHESPTMTKAFAIGLIGGLATIMRPTELIIFLIPLLWNTHSKETAKAKWAQVKKHKKHIGLVALAAFIGAMPQLIYWLYVTGSPIHVIGSKWYFLNPYFRVLFGWQKGWFIYTPITIFFVLGMFYMRGLPFRKSVIWFCVLNIWIVISWSVWRYGGSYSTRALVQSYPVFALALGAVITKINTSKYRALFYMLAIYLTSVNLFQIWQYQKGILRHDEMNRAYYQAVYLDKNPSPLDMSMLDDGQKHAFDCRSKIYYKNQTSKEVIPAGEEFYTLKLPSDRWVDLDLSLRSQSGFWKGYIVISMKNGDGEEIEVRKFRMFNYLTKHNTINRYNMHLKMPEEGKYLSIRFGGGEDVSAKVKKLSVFGCTE